MNQKLFDECYSNLVLSSSSVSKVSYSLTPTQLRLIFPKIQQQSELLNSLNFWLNKYQINTSLRVRHFLTQISHESSGLLKLEENLNYSASRLLAVFPRHFDGISAASYAHKPQNIANKVYGGRYGNGSELTGDGWRYRGKGGIHITFKNNYKKIGDFLSKDYVSRPDDLLELDAAISTSVAYWSICRINAHADEDSLINCTIAVNGGTNGLESRKAIYENMKKFVP